jgi:putative ABC transport system permease protein
MSQRSLVTTLKEAGQASHGPARHRTMASLVVVQLALSVALLSAAGLLMRSYLRLQGGNPGFDTRRLLALRVVRPDTRADGEAGLRTAFFQHATTELAALPGVTASAAVSLPPISRDNSNTSIRISGLASTMPRQPWAELRSVSAGYFTCLGIPLLRGRALDAHDTADNRRVAVISQELARRYFPDRDPLGRSVGFDGFDWTVVGVVGDVTLRSLRSAGPDPTLYRPITQHCERQMTLFVRTIGDPLKWAEPARKAIAAVDPDQPILDTHTMTDLATASLFVERSSMYLLALLASLSLVIGSVGFHAVLSSVVDDSRGEIAVRVALGADSAQVFRLVLRRGLSLTVPGLAVGLAVAGSVGRLMRKLVYNVASPDPLTLALVALLLLAVALLACYLPARRAARLDPIEALKCD